MKKINDHEMNNDEITKESVIEEIIEITEKSVENEEDKEITEESVENEGIDVVMEEATEVKSGPIPIEGIDLQENEEIIDSPTVQSEPLDSANLTVTASAESPRGFSGYKSQDKEPEVFRDPTRIR